MIKKCISYYEDHDSKIWNLKYKKFNNKIWKVKNYNELKNKEMIW